MQKTKTFRRIESIADAAMAALPVVEYGDDLREEFTAEYKAFLQIGDALHDLIEEVSARDTTDTDLWNGLLGKAATLASGMGGASPGGEESPKSEDFKAMEQAVKWTKGIPSIQGVEEFCSYMDIGNAFLKLAEQISERDETDTDAWNQLIRTIHTIAAGSDDIPDKDTVGRVRRIEKELKREEDEIIPVRARHIEEGADSSSWIKSMIIEVSSFEVPSARVEYLTWLEVAAVARTVAAHITDIMDDGDGRIEDDKAMALVFSFRAVVILLSAFSEGLPVQYFPSDLRGFYMSSKNLEAQKVPGGKSSVTWR